jgi:aldose 1-epimerase
MKSDDSESCRTALTASVGGVLELASGELRLTVAPDIGGSIASFYRSWNDGQKDRRTDWLRPASEAALATGRVLEMASFPLLPFCNRIRDGRGAFEGRTIRLMRNHPDGKSAHPLHGIGWQRPWQVLHTDASTASLSLDVAADSAWPWSFSARQDFILTENRLSLTLTLTNTDTAAMPAGIGQHPYFLRNSGTRLTSVTRGMWQTDAEVMPTGFVQQPCREIDSLAKGLRPAEVGLDHNFTGWNRSALVEWPADAHGPACSLTMTAESPLDYLVVYTPPDADHFCAEPVSQCTDWLNLQATYRTEQTGGARLLPGQSLAARVEWRPAWSGR